MLWSYYVGYKGSSSFFEPRGESDLLSTNRTTLAIVAPRPIAAGVLGSCEYDSGF